MIDKNNLNRIKGILSAKTGAEIPKDIIDEKVKRCFDFISGILDEYIEYSPIQISQESTTIISAR